MNRNQTSLVLVAMLLAFSFLVGCSTLQKRRRNPECRAIYQEVKEGCHRDSTGQYWLSNKARAGGEMNILNHQDCFQGLAQRDMGRLFGKPDTMSREKMVYYLSEPCLAKEGLNATACHYMRFSFDAQDGLKRIEFVHVSGEMDFLAPDKGKH